mmetsp:Transcript_15452/g.34035  ORF Transcript_15452/g.34035 Transcript_15452/m.34035 type:complete len:223 (+) Transcript_15452:119-787(+)
MPPAAAASAADAPKAEADGEEDDFEDIVDSPGGELKGLLLEDDGDAGDTETDFVFEQGGSDEDTAFDQSVGALQEIVMGEEFEAMLRGFCLEHCHHFEDNEENKLIYTELFQKYSELIEGHLDKQLRALIPGFEMSTFLSELTRRGEGEVDGPVFELLLSLGDFDSFKQTMLASGAKRSSLIIDGTKSRIHQDEDEEGDERPDLADLLVVAPASPPRTKKST